MVALAQGKDAKFFFTYWSLEYLKMDKPLLFKLDKEAESHKELLKPV
jgi:peroxiredoxin family protein